jgi:hypothetical protein
LSQGTVDLYRIDAVISLDAPLQKVTQHTELGEHALAVAPGKRARLLALLKLDYRLREVSDTEKRRLVAPVADVSLDLVNGCGAGREVVQHDASRDCVACGLSSGGSRFGCAPYLSNLANRDDYSK